MKSLRVLLLLSALLLFGCNIDRSTPSAGAPEIRVGDPYDAIPARISLKTSADIAVPVTNPRREPVDIEIREATLTASQNAGFPLYVQGIASPIRIAGGSTGYVNISFRDIPILYQFQGNPLKLVPVITSYAVIVRYVGTVRICVVLVLCRNYSQEDSVSQSVDMKEIKIPDSWFKLPVPESKG